MSDKTKKIVLNVSFATLVLLTVAAPFVCWNCMIHAVRAMPDPEPIVAVGALLFVAMIILGITLPLLIVSFEIWHLIKYRLFSSRQLRFETTLNRVLCGLSIFFLLLGIACVLLEPIALFLNVDLLLTILFASVMIWDVAYPLFRVTYFMACIVITCREKIVKRRSLDTALQASE